MKTTKNEQWLRERYDEVQASGDKRYALVSIKIKRYRLIARLYGRVGASQVTDYVFGAINSWLKHGEYAAHIRLGYFNALILLEAKEDENLILERFNRLEDLIGEMEDERFNKTISCGYGVWFVEDGVAFDIAQYNADICRSESGDNSQWVSHIEVYGQSFIDQDIELNGLKLEIKKALENQEIHMYLQPKVDLKTGQVKSAEALVRWIDPVKGIRPVSSFLPALELSGTTNYIDYFMFEQACRTSERWYKQTGNKICISINLSQRAFNYPLFFKEFTDIFDQYDCPADCLEFELLESIVLNQVERVGKVVRQIRDYGFSCSLDDFGSGYSSYSVLTNSDLSAVKIDRSLFQNENSKRERLVIKHIIQTARELEMKTVAEGVETMGYVEYLRELECDCIQGFVFYKPMPVQEFEKRFITGSEIAPLYNDR